MIKLRIQYINEKEYVSAISKPIKNRNHPSYRVYIEGI